MIGDCTLCGGPVVLDPGSDRGPVEACQGECGNAQRTRPVFTGIRDAVRASRVRRLLGPSCLGRLHHRCTAQLCECTCHDKEAARGAQA